MKLNADFLKQMFSNLSKNADIPSFTFKNLGSKQFANIVNDIPSENVIKKINPLDDKLPF